MSNLKHNHLNLHSLIPAFDPEILVKELLSRKRIKTSVTTNKLLKKPKKVNFSEKFITVLKIVEDYGEQILVSFSLPNTEEEKVEESKNYVFISEHSIRCRERRD